MKYFIGSLIGVAIFILGSQAFHEYQAVHPWRASALGLLAGLLLIRYLVRITR